MALNSAPLWVWRRHTGFGIQLHRNPGLRQHLRSKLPCDGHCEHQEFSNHLSFPCKSTGLLLLRDTLVDPTPVGETLLGQRVLIVEKPAPTPDASGGARALAAAARQVVQEAEEWVVGR